MFCYNCGISIEEGETICKGCGKLTAGVIEELRAMTEESADLKCKKCGRPVKKEHLYCSECGAPAAAC